MKKILAILMTIILTAGAAVAQPGYGRPGMGGPGHGRYGHGGYGRGYDRHRHGRYDNLYGGIKFGVTVSHITLGSSDLEADGLKTGMNLGLAAGFAISPFAAFESGLYYVEKGGIGRESGSKITYDLHYLELPILLKFNIFSGNRAVFQPYAGAYLGYGVGGRIKDYRTEICASSFNDANIRRGDSGLAFGCGVTWSFMHANLGYEYGLSDISRHGFGDNRNRALILSVGLAF